MAYVSRGFRGKRAKEREDARLPPGQYLSEDFPVLSAGPTPHTELTDWSFSIESEVSEPLTRWSWDEFRALPSEQVTVDIHCVTKWSKLDTTWEGVSIETLLDGVEYEATHAMAFSDGDYTTNVPLEDLLDGKAWVAFAFGGQADVDVLAGAVSRPARHGEDERLGAGCLDADVDDLRALPGQSPQ